MISHHLTQIYKQQVLNEAAILPDDVKQAMINNLDSINQIFYQHSSDIKSLLSDAPVSDDEMHASTTATHYACTHALKYYKNIDVAIQNNFQLALDTLKSNDRSATSWWGYGQVIDSYMQYCNRFGKKPVIAKQFALQVLQKDNVAAFKKIKKWGAAAHIIEIYLTKTKEFEEQFEPLIKNAVMANEYTDAEDRDLISSYYSYYIRTMKKPCNWIDMMVCNAADENEASKIFARISWMRRTVAPDNQQHIYNAQEFRHMICNKNTQDGET